MWAFVAATYWISFVAYCLLWKAYKHVSNLRATALMSRELKVEQLAVVVRDIPPVPEGQTRKEQVDSYFKAIYPDTFYRSMVVTNNKEVYVNDILVYMYSLFFLEICILELVEVMNILIMSG